MREHVTNQIDKNGDRLISLQEFMQDTEAQTPNKDEGWKDLGNQPVYTDEELKMFEEEYAREMGRFLPSSVSGMLEYLLL